MVTDFYLYSRSSIYSGAEKMLFLLAKGINSVSKKSKVYLNYSADDFSLHDNDFIFERNYQSGLVKISTKPYMILVYFFFGFFDFFKVGIRKKNSILIFNDLESLVFYWPCALINRSCFYLHDSHKVENIKGRIICKIISFLVNDILVITQERVRILNSIGIKNTIYFPNCTLSKPRFLGKNTNSDEVHCICVAQIAKWKRIDKVISVFNALAGMDKDKNWFLHICGRPNENDIEGLLLQSEIIQQSKLDTRIIYHGYLHDLSFLWQQCSLLLSMSENEPFGLALVEALQQGCYIISSEGEGPNEIISSDVIGKIIPTGVNIDEWVGRNINTITINYDSHDDIRVNSSNRYSYECYLNNIKNTWFNGI